ncbi:MAG TPA: superoxide dismutase [Flavobacteriales bacterium]|nr:superoxide dismutase [Flavobacteriales bacterium]
MDRKQFLSRSLKVSVGALVGGPVLASVASCNAPEAPTSEAVTTETTPTSPALQLAQIALPYDYPALEPSVDARTMEIHYTKHHAAYVKNVNEAIVAEGVAAKDEMDLLARVGSFSAKVRNNAGGTWNHNFFWQVMGPGGKGSPEGKVLDALNAGFGSFDKFKDAFTDAAMKRFGSGWAWLVERNGELAIGSTPNQDSPLMDVSELRGTPLLGLDVWEHAYYLKYQNKRNEYVANWWQVVNWDEVAKRMA